MRFNHSSKRDLYFEKAMKLYFEEGMCGTHICKVLPISRGILYKWIAKVCGTKSASSIHETSPLGLTR